MPLGADEKPGHREKPNRLAKETSPYLLLHAHNPVDWYPWGEDALTKAKREGKIIFLSVGYSSCHWCHVMERESFLDEEIAGYLNEHFVCIKVDREERPEIDAIYMTSLHVFNQLSKNGRGGGWPLSMFLTPEAEPFFGGTYIPARDGDRGISTGFLTLLKKVQDVWTMQPANIRDDAKTLTKYVKIELENQRPALLVKLTPELTDNLQQVLTEEFDEKHGGFGYVASNPFRPKFPEPSNLLFLLDRVRRAKAAGDSLEPALSQLTVTLDHLAMGGIRDHLDGGFHRYSVDRYWRIPHFEKMLYDNGQLASVYAEAASITDREDYRRVAREIADFVLERMTSPEGGFYSAMDAESENEEGKYYRWTRAEVEAAIDDGELRSLFMSVYGLDRDPNFEEEYYVPQLAEPLLETAAARGVPFAELDDRLSRARRLLREVRAKRTPPLTDTKILAGWNGLMIRGLADCGRILNEPRYLRAAEAGAEFLRQHMTTPDGRLFRTYGQGNAKLNAYVGDYAFIIDGLIGLHRATGDERWLARAEKLMESQIELFWDDASGGFFFTSHDHESLLARAKEISDSAEPAGNSVSAQNLLYLASVLQREPYRQKAERTIMLGSRLLAQSPAAVPRLTTAVAELLAARNDAEK
ncbi:MAG: thioredoxin domain-containing protein [Planctomycetes bacterium]|nr:thioredoxin domain-containing protein [Planctomycetota bacterium]